jgi:hypothetical protein
MLLVALGREKHSSLAIAKESKRPAPSTPALCAYAQGERILLRLARTHSRRYNSAIYQPEEL